MGLYYVWGPSRLWKMQKAVRYLDVYKQVRGWRDDLALESTYCLLFQRTRVQFIPSTHIGCPTTICNSGSRDLTLASTTTCAHMQVLAPQTRLHTGDYFKKRKPYISLHTNNDEIPRHSPFFLSQMFLPLIMDKISYFYYSFIYFVCVSGRVCHGTDADVRGPYSISQETKFDDLSSVS